MDEETPAQQLINVRAKPALTTKTRLQTDQISKERILLYPEGIVQLNPTGAAIVELCDGQHTFQQIIEILAAHYQTSIAELQGDIETFLKHLYNESLLEWHTLSSGKGLTEYFRRHIIRSYSIRSACIL